MASVLLSQHSSNPLEVGSSDPRNTHYHRAYRKTQEARCDDRLSSDDLAVGGYRPPELDAYQDHIVSLFPSIGQQRMSSIRAGKQPVPPGYIDLDVDMESDDELRLPPTNHQPHHAVTEAEGDVGGDEEDLGFEDAEGEDDDDESIHLKPPEERAEIQVEIEELESCVPQLSTDYRLVDRLGTGTFSSVYKAIDLLHDRWDNSTWHDPIMRACMHQSSPSLSTHSRVRGGRIYVAVKRIYVTSSPDRIRNEIAIMESCIGCRHTSQLITAFRHKDQVVAVMPYHRNEDFRDYFRELPMPAVKSYLRCMFRALRDIHARGVIHRDVKPANFLFDPRTGIGYLCDFGLACRMEPSNGIGTCLHTPPTRADPHGRVRGRQEYNIEHIKRMQREARQKGTMNAAKVGYPDKDPRPVSKANRAGTRGFRAPEVLLKCIDQSGAVDVWSVGMILLFFLVRKFPLFQSNDDIEALMEIAVIIGRKRMEKVATLHSRTFATNVPSVTIDGVSWRDFVERQNLDLYTPPEPNTNYYPYTMGPPTSIRSSLLSMPPPPVPLCRVTPSSPPSQHAKGPSEHAQDVELAFDLLDRALHPESTHRITPREALIHPFLRDLNEPDDDKMFPHPFGEGVCGNLHFIDEVTESPCVRVRILGKQASGEDDKMNEAEEEMEVLTLKAGEGIAIGDQPCQFHRDAYYAP